ncbi:hypothetical protein [Streptomyces boetiae]
MRPAPLQSGRQLRGPGWRPLRATRALPRAGGGAQRGQGLPPQRARDQWLTGGRPLGRPGGGRGPAPPLRQVAVPQRLQLLGNARRDRRRPQHQPPPRRRPRHVPLGHRPPGDHQPPTGPRPRGAQPVLGARLHQHFVPQYTRRREPGADGPGGIPGLGAPARGADLGEVPQQAPAGVELGR